MFCFSPVLRGLHFRAACFDYTRNAIFWIDHAAFRRWLRAMRIYMKKAECFLGEIYTGL